MSKQNKKSPAANGCGCLATLLFFPIAVIFELAKKYK